MRAKRAIFVLGALMAASACDGSDAQRDAFMLNSGAPAAGTSSAGVPIGGDSGVTAAPGAGSGDLGAAPNADPGATAATPSSPGSPSKASPGAASTPSGGAGSGAATAAPRAGSGTAASPSQRSSAGAPAGSPANPNQPAAPTPGGATNPNSDVGVTANSIKVGHIGIYSGPVGYVGQHLSLAARATLQSINDAGGINGRKLDVVVRDDGWDGTKGVNAARDLIERQKVFALCCIQSVSTSDPVTPYVDQQKVPHVGGDGWGQPQFKGQYSFPLGAPAASEARVLAKYQYEQQGVRSAAVLHLNSPTGQSFRDAYKEALEKLGGKVQIIQPATFDDPGTTTLIARARAANVDTIAIYVDSGIVARLLREAAGQNYKPSKGFAGSAFYYFRITHELTGPAGEGLISASHWTPHDQDTPGLRRYREVVQKYYPDIDHTSWTVTSFMGANLFGNVLKKLGLNVTRQGVKDSLEQVTDFDLGLGTRVTFRPGKRYANTQIHLVQVQRQGDKLGWKSLNYTDRDPTYDK